MDSSPRQYPAIKGLAWHRAQYYSFFAPIDWQPFSWPDDRAGEIYGPDPDDPLTVFSVAVQDLGTAIASEDLDTLADGFFETIEQMPESDIEVRDQQATDMPLMLEAKYTFRDQQDTRKCWVRVFYHGTRQITMTAQGATVEKYNYWQPLFFEAMMTARVHTQKPDIESMH